MPRARAGPRTIAVEKEIKELHAAQPRIKRVWPSLTPKAQAQEIKKFREIRRRVK